MESREPRPIEATDEPEWDGFRRRRWANRYALLFASTFGPSTWLLFTGIDIGQYGRGREVASLVVGLFVLVTLTVGFFLGRQLGWRLEGRARTAALLVTLAAGIASLVGSWGVYRTSAAAGDERTIFGSR